MRVASLGQLSSAPAEWPGRFSRLELLWLLLWTALGAWLRVHGLAGFAITHWDEGLAWEGARWFASAGAHGHYSPTHAPPLVPALFGLIELLFGAGPRGALFVDLVLATASLPLVWALTRRLAGPAAASFALVALACSPLHSLWARSLLTESAYVFLLLLALLAGAEALARPGRRWWWLAGGAAALLQLTKYNGFLVLLPLVAARLATLPPAARATRGRLLPDLMALFLPCALALSANVAALVASGKWSDFLAHYTRYIGAQTPRPGDLHGLLVWLGERCGFGRHSAWLPWLGYLALVPACARSPRSPRLIAHAAFLLYTVFFFRYTFYLRLLAPVLTLYCVELGLAVAGLPERLRRAALPVLVAFVALLGARAARALLPFPSGGYAAAAERIAAELPGAVPLLVTQEHVWLDAPFAAGVLNLPSRRAEERLAAGGEVLLVLDLCAFSRRAPADLLPLYERLDREWRVAEIDNPLGWEVLQNNIAPAELERLERDPALARRIGAIHLFRLPAASLIALLRELGLHP